jgi:hypothetical protein
MSGEATTVIMFEEDGPSKPSPGTSKMGKGENSKYLYMALMVVSVIVFVLSLSKLYKSGMQPDPMHITGFVASVLVFLFAVMKIKKSMPSSAVSTSD